LRVASVILFIYEVSLACTKVSRLSHLGARTCRPVAVLSAMLHSVLEYLEYQVLNNSMKVREKFCKTFLLDHILLLLRLFLFWYQKIEEERVLLL
jgi:hypothetical protein